MVYVSSPTDSGETTPLDLEEQEHDESEYQQALILQKYIKGRAIQNLIHRGKEQCRDLIDELQSGKTLDSVRALFPEEGSSKASIVEDESDREKVRAEMSGDISLLLKFLSSELERLQEERKAHAMVLLAERERDRRENWNKTQAEIDIEKRKHCEGLYRNVFKAEHDVVTTYLENVLMEGITELSEEEARVYIRETAKKIDEAADVQSRPTKEQKIRMMLKNQIFPEILSKIPDQYINMISDILDDFLTQDLIHRLAETQGTADDLQSAATFIQESVVPELMKRAAEHNMWNETQTKNMKVAADLIQEFIAPEILKIMTRDRQKRERQAHLTAAHDAIWKCIDNLPEIERRDSREKSNEEEKDDTATLSQVSSLDSNADVAQYESMHVINDCISKTLMHVMKSSSSQRESECSEEPESETSSAKLNFQKELLNRIVNNLNEKLKKQLEEDVETNRRRSSSRASIDIYLQGSETKVSDDDTES